MIEARVCVSGWIDKGFLGLDRLVLAIAPAAPGHHPTGELIHDHRLAIADDVVHVLHEQLLGLEGVGDVVGPGILGVEQIRHAEHLLGFGETFIGEGAAALLLIHLVIAFGIDAVFAQLSGTNQGIGHLGRLLVFLLGPFHLAGNDQGGAGFVDQDRIHLVNHAVLELPLHHLR